MALKQNTVRKDLIPYEAGVVIITPLDANKKPDYTRSVATQRDFLTSTQTSVTRTTETLANGNGADKEYIVDEAYTLTIVGNTYNPDFHAVVAGRIQSEQDRMLAFYEKTVNLPKTTDTGLFLEITFGSNKDIAHVPAMESDGTYFFIVEDSYGNRMVPGKEPSDGVYHFDSGTNTLEFTPDYAEQAIRVVFKYESGDGWRIASNPILSQPEFQIETFGLRSSASTDEKYRTHILLARASYSGDLSEQTTQKAKSAPITYTFRTTPVPAGTSVYVEETTPYVE